MCIEKNWAGYISKMSQGFKRNSKQQRPYTLTSEAFPPIPCRNLEKPPRLDKSIPWNDMVYRDKGQPQKKNFIERIKAPLFFETDLAVETIEL